VELFLNLAWLAVATVIVCLWFRGENRNDPDRRRQLIALVVLIAILFPVISVSDDLLAVQSASEADSCLRRDHLVPSSPHPVQPVLSIVPPPIFAGLGCRFLRFVSIDGSSFRVLDRPELAAIQNRPPPAA
jgi:hypothetical protein